MRLAEYDPLISSVEPKTRSWVHVNEGRLYLAYRDWALRMGWILQALISILKAANAWNQIQVLRFKVHLHGKSGRIEPPVREPTDHHLDGTWNSACPIESWIIKEFAKEKVQAVNAQPVHGSWLGFLLAFRRTQWIRIHTLQAIMYLNCVRTTIMPGLAVVNKCPVKMLFFNLFKPAQSQSNPIPVAFHAFKQKQLSANDKALPEKWACSIQVKMIMVLVAKRPSWPSRRAGTTRLDHWRPFLHIPSDTSDFKKLSYTRFWSEFQNNNLLGLLGLTNQKSMESVERTRCFKNSRRYFPFSHPSAFGRTRWAQ